MFIVKHNKSWIKSINVKVLLVPTPPIMNVKGVGWVHGLDEQKI